MFDIVLKNIFKKYNNDEILNNLNLTIPAQSFFVLLGPSGCGKTTILKLIGGFEYPDKGDVFFGKDNVTKISANKRSVNTVFQNYALFPHLTVYDNIAYGLKIKNISSFEIRKKIDKIADSFGINKYLNKSIKELSGGEQQRVAVARAIANEPLILLLDEPISALDFKLREKTLRELSDLQEQLKMIFVYVTHDQFEALTVADYIAIFNEEGVIEQIGTPQEIYEKPASLFVAKFIGKTNIINCSINNNIISIEEWGEYPFHNKIYQKGSYMLSLRPERVVFLTNDDTSLITIKGVVKSIIYYGYATEYIIMSKAGLIKVLDKNFNSNITYESEVLIGWNINDTVFLRK